jgi:hypothetical protein
MGTFQIQIDVIVHFFKQYNRYFFKDNLSLLCDGFDIVIKVEHIVGKVCSNIMSCANIWY